MLDICHVLSYVQEKNNIHLSNNDHNHFHFKAAVFREQRRAKLWENVFRYRPNHILILTSSKQHSSPPFESVFPQFWYSSMVLRSRWRHSYRPMCTHDRSQFREKRVHFESMFAITNVCNFLKKGSFWWWCTRYLEKGYIFVIHKNVKS